MNTQFHLLKSKRFLPLFVTQFFGAFNDNAFKNAFLIWFTYDALNQVANTKGLNINPAMMVTIAAGLFILPFFLFSALAGQVADKYEKSFLTQKIKKVEIVLMLLCAIFFLTQNTYGLLALIFLMGMQSAFFGPIKYSLLPEHLHDDELVAGNGLIESGTFISILLGTIFGSLIIRAEYGAITLSLCVISFAIIGWLSSRYIPQSNSSDPSLKIKWNIAKEIMLMVGYARKNYQVWYAILGISWFWLIGSIFLTQFPTYSKNIIGGNEKIVTLFLTIFSLGIAIGSMLCHKLLKGEINGKIVPIGSAGISISIIIFVIGSWLYQNTVTLGTAEINILQFLNISYSSYIILTGLLLLAISSGIYIVPLYAIMQHFAEHKYLSRIIATNNIMNACFMVIASIFLITLFSIGLKIVEIFLIVSIANIAILAIIGKVTHKS